jgi:hypothetical protein
MHLLTIDSLGWESQDLEIRESPNGQVFVQDLSLIPIRNIQEVTDVLETGLKLR